MIRIKTVAIALGSVLTLAMAASLWWNHNGLKRQVWEIARSQAEAHYERDRAMRFWGGGHGGVYVPVTKRTQPNPALSHMPHRDIEGPDGRMLTLMNPAYMIRQINEDISSFARIRAHMTSLKPLRPENIAVGWERDALIQFEGGGTEVLNITKSPDGSEMLNFMRPLIVVQACLKCHAQQGYQVGDVRGGVAITVSLDSLYQASAKRWRVILGTHLLLWALGMSGLVLGAQTMIRGKRNRDEITRHLEETTASTEAVLDNLPMGVMLVGYDKVIRRINQTALDILGKREGDVLGSVCHQHVCPAQEGSCPILDLNTKIDNSEKIVMGADGKIIPVLKSVIPFLYQGEKVLLEAFVDITERKESISRLTESLKDLRRFNNLAVDRELRMVELKAEINLLLEEHGQPTRYKVDSAPVGEGLS